MENIGYASTSTEIDAESSLIVFGRQSCQPFCSFMDRHCINWTYNDRQLQYILSTVCGAYCVFFAIYKSYGHNMHRIVCAFTDNTIINDCVVDRFVRKLK